MPGEVQNERFRELVKEITELHESKMKDYGTVEDPIMNLREFGLPGVIIRINDKVIRLKSFLRNGKLYVKDESVVDTLKDLATYSLLGIQLYEEEKKGKNAMISIEVLGQPDPAISSPALTPQYVQRDAPERRDLHEGVKLGESHSYEFVPKEKRPLNLQEFKKVLDKFTERVLKRNGK